MEKATVAQLAAVISENRGSFRVRVIFETYWERGETWPLRRVSLAIIQGSKAEQVRCELISQKNEPSNFSFYQSYSIILFKL